MTRDSGARVLGRRISRHLAQVIGVAVAAGVLMQAGCAPKIIEPSEGTAPRYPQFLYPAVPQGTWGPEAVALHERGWRFLQAGDLASAERNFALALKLSPEFYPADAAMGYVRLAERAFGAAVSDFDRALGRAGGYVPALVGRGDALLSASRPLEALESFHAALARDPSLAEVERRVEVIGLRVQQDALAAARKAMESGDYEQAQKAYELAIAGSPDSAFLYRDLAAVEQLQGRPGRALQLLRKATDLDPGDAKTWVKIGDLLEGQQDFGGAVAAFAKAAEVEPSPVASERLERARGRAALATMPAEYQRIPESSRLTRGDLAALVGIRLEKLLQQAPRGETAVITDVREHWAAAWIQAVTRAGLMDIYPNHEFQPHGVIRRADLASVAGRALQIIGKAQPRRHLDWQQGRPAISDIPAENVNYVVTALVVTAGVMPLAEGGAFLPARPVSGAEALDVLGRLEVLSRWP